MGFIEGVNAANSSISMDRREKQRELTNRIKGFEKDSKGNYNPNERGDKLLELQNQKLEQKLMVTENENNTIKSILNKDTLQSAITHLGMGRQKDASKLIDSNPILKEKLRENFDIHGIVPVDFINDRDELRELGLNITDEMLKDKQTMNALNSSLYKTIGSDGKMHIKTVQDTIKATNYLGYADSKLSSGMIERFNRIGEIMKGHLVTDDERQLIDDSNKLKSTNIKSNQMISELKQSSISDILDDDSLTSDEKEIRINEVMKGNVKSSDERQLIDDSNKLKSTNIKSNQMISELKQSSISDILDDDSLTSDEKEIRINEVMKGNVKSSDERQLIDDSNKLKSTNIKSNQMISELKQSFISDILDDDSLTDAEKMNKISGTSKEKDYKILKAMYDLEYSKGRVESQNRDKTLDKLKGDKLELDIKSKKDEIAKSNIKGSSDFLINLFDRDKVKYNDENLRKAKAIQGKAPVTGTVKQLDKKLTLVKQTSSLYDKLSKANIDRNAIQKLGKALFTVTGISNKKEKERILEEIKLDSNLKAITAEYIKFMSGAAVTDEERKIYTGIISSGDWSTKESSLVSLKSFMNYIDESYRTDLEGINLPYEQLIRREKYDRWKNKSMQQGKPSIIDDIKTDTIKPNKNNESVPDLSKYIRG